MNEVFNSLVSLEDELTNFEAWCINRIANAKMEVKKVENILLLTGRR